MIAALVLLTALSVNENVGAPYECRQDSLSVFDAMRLRTLSHDAIDLAGRAIRSGETDVVWTAISLVQSNGPVVACVDPDSSKRYAAWQATIIPTVGL